MDLIIYAVAALAYLAFCLVLGRWIGSRLAESSARCARVRID